MVPRPGGGGEGARAGLGGDHVHARAPREVRKAHDVRQWTELPLWRTHAGVWQVDPARAVTAGLHCRPLTQTIAQTWDWMREGGTAIPYPRAAEHGISPERETAVLGAGSAPVISA